MSNERWGGTVNKVLAIFIIVLALHFMIILLIGWFNVWRTGRLLEEEAKKEQAEEDNYFLSGEEAIRMEKEDDSNIIINDTSMNDEFPVADEPGPDDDILPPFEEAILPEPNMVHRQIERKEEGNSSYNTYTVAEGNTLYGIARKTGVSLDELRKINHIEDDLIRVGQMLKIPSMSNAQKSPKKDLNSKTGPANPKSQSISPVDSPRYGLYLVKKDDTLSRIARLYHTTTERLARLNAMKDPSKLSPGEEIKVPSGLSILE